MNTTVTYRSTETGVRIRIDDETAAIDVSSNPDHPVMKKAVELAITYKITETRDGITGGVTNLTYLLDDPDAPIVYVHPDYLDQSQKWPEWVRNLVDEHRPA
ncbi:hypothetical protein [Streptomyces sp. CFMR 7]|uniref:hypothetical protein n=1 Tax=Streptomyces sp. CFMR 7 TaxID=1649184 RepID=UPI0011A7330E|nr:hypothetical protein [Streptomyces sp. CFMR 7]